MPTVELTLTTTTLRDLERRLMQPLAHQIARVCSAEVLTLFGLVVALLGFYGYWHGVVWLGGLCIFINGFVDLLDGGVARARNQTSIVGSFYDRITDKYADMLLIGGTLAGGLCHPLPAILALVGIPLATYTNSAVEHLSQGKIKLQDKFSLRFVRMAILLISSLANQVSIAIWVIAIIVVYALISRTLWNIVVLQRLVREGERR